MNEDIVRSPFFYVGDKYKLMSQLRHLFPENISTYVEPFVGGGSSFLNTKADRYIVNDINFYVIELHKCLASYANRTDEFLSKLYALIDEYGLSCSYRGILVPYELKLEYVKTYYSHYNKAAYEKLRDRFNQEQDMLVLYLLLIYGFNHMIRFNSMGKFNLPVGNVDFNKNVFNAICHYMNFMANNNVTFTNKDFREFLDSIELDKNSYVYLDPPYLISGSEYNKYWSVEEEQRLCDYLDVLNQKGIRFGITNLIMHKGKTNDIFIEWSKKYVVYDITSNYISFNDNSIKSTSKEVFVTNYGRK